MKQALDVRSSRTLAALAAFASAGLIGEPAEATDEIQVYNASIAAVGQFTIQQHLNYIPQGLTNPPLPGALVSNHSLNGTPEFAYGMTKLLGTRALSAVLDLERAVLLGCLQVENAVRHPACR